MSILPVLTTKDTYVQYAPLSLEFFEAYWSSPDPQNWIELLWNETYFPPKLFNDLENKQELMNLANESSGSQKHVKGSVDYTFSYNFIYRMINHPNVSDEFLLGLPAHWAYDILANVNVSTRVVSHYLKDDYENYSHALEAAYHSNAPLKLAFPKIIEELNTYSVTLYPVDMKELCDKYLREICGWNEETLASTPYSLKLALVS